MIAIVLLLVAASADAFSWVHISDVHVDTKYHPGAPAECVGGTAIGTGCCREWDVPLPNSTRRCSPWGDLANDVPEQLVDGLLGWIAGHLRADAIINTGDDGSHKAVDQVFTNDNRDSILLVSALTGKHLPNTPSYRVIGNHDAYWNVDQTFPGYSGFLKQTTAAWTKWVDDPHLPAHGFYSTAVPGHPGLRIVALNSLLYDTNNFFQINTSTADAERGGDQLVWLREELATCRANRERVLLLNHIPLEAGESNAYMNEHLALALTDFADVIVVMLNGHSHRDRFRLYRNSTTRQFVAAALINPSIVTDRKYPTFRVYNLTSCALLSCNRLPRGDRERI